MLRLIVGATRAVAGAIGQAVSKVARMLGLRDDGAVTATTAPVIGLRFVALVAGITGGVLRLVPTRIAATAGGVLLGIASLLWGFADADSDAYQEVVLA